MLGRTGIGAATATGAECQGTKAGAGTVSSSTGRTDGRTSWFQPLVAELKAVLVSTAAKELEKLISDFDAAEAQMRLWLRCQEIHVKAAAMEQKAATSRWVQPSHLLLTEMKLMPAELAPWMRCLKYQMAVALSMPPRLPSLMRVELTANDFILSSL